MKKQESRRGIKIKYISDGKYLKLKDYVVFENNWITKHDTILFNQDNEEFIVLDFQEIEENTLTSTTLLPFINGRVKQKLSCVKLNKNVEKNDIFYVRMEK